MNFEMPMATAAMNNAVAYADVDEGSECWDVIGAPLDHGVDRTLVDYDSKLELNLQPKPGAKRQEVCDLRWGKIEKDAARLEGLAAAIENISSVVRKGRDQLAHEWKGESFDAFRASIEKVEQVLNEYAKAARSTGQGFRDAMSAVRTLYNSYRDTSTNIFRFDGMAPPNDWWKMSEDSGEHLAERCTSMHAWECTYNNDQQQGVINGKLVNNRLFNQLEGWDCTDNPGVSLSQYRSTVGWAEEEKQAIQDKIHEWYVATDSLKDGVGQLHTAALDNLQVMAERKVFQSMQTPGAPTGTGDPGQTDSDGGRRDPGSGRGPGDTGSGGGDPGGGGGPGSPGSPASPGSPGGTDPAGAAPISAEAPGTGTQEPTGTPGPRADETVTISAGDHEITVSSPDGQGNVQVTVDDGTGNPKTYDLNFGSGTAPSGSAQEPIRTLPYPSDPGDPTGSGQPGPGGTPGTGTGGREPGDAATPIEPGPDGKCVVQDGPMTITAERPPGTTDQVVVTVDDGAGNPTTYTLDYADPASGSGAPVAQPLRAGMPDADPRAAGPAPTAEPVGPAATPDTGVRYAEPAVAQGQPVAASAQTAGFAPAGGAGPVPAGFGVPGEPVQQTVAQGSFPGESSGGVAAAAGAQTAGFAPAGGAGSVPAGFGVPGEPVQQTVAQGSFPGESSGGAAAAAGGFGGSSGSLGQVGSVGFPGDSEYTHVPAQTTGEAGLASASDGGGQPAPQQAHGGGTMAGGGMPMMAGAGAGAGGGGDSERSASQWRTAGDLFDDSVEEPAGRFGGVLESDDQGQRR